MLGSERRNKIMEILHRDSKVYVSQLAKDFGITEETVRRNLEKLESQQLLQRSYGGAVLPEKAQNDISFDQRSITNVYEKRALTNKAASLIEDGDTTFMDSSSTALMLRPQLVKKKDCAGRGSLKLFLLHGNRPKAIRSLVPPDRAAEYQIDILRQIMTGKESTKC